MTLLLGFLFALLFTTAFGNCPFDVQIMVHRYNNTFCMDSKAPQIGARIDEKECMSWKHDNYTFESFAVQWMPNVDGEDVDCHGDCWLNVYDVNDCGKPSKLDQEKGV